MNDSVNELMNDSINEWMDKQTNEQLTDWLTARIVLKTGLNDFFFSGQI